MMKYRAMLTYLSHSLADKIVSKLFALIDSILSLSLPDKYHNNMADNVVVS